MTPLKMLAGTLGAGLLALAAGAACACTLQTVGELNVDLSRRAPIVDGEINGVKVKIVIDTGSSLTMITAPAAKALGLIGAPTPGGYVFGIGGRRDTYATVLKSLKVGTLTGSDLPPITVGGALAGEPDVAMLLGSDFLSQFDVELDLAHNMIRLFRADGCTPPQLVYWNKPYSQADLVASDRDSPVVMATALLNGKRQPVQIDSGADVTIVDEHVASNLGVRRGGAGEVHIEGLGPQDRAGWIGQFDSFALGDEQIAHPRLTVIKLAQDTVDNGGAYMVPKSLDGNTPPTMLIGADFIRAHHLLIGVQEHVLVFSYSGGPIFSAPAAPPAAK